MTTQQKFKDAAQRKRYPAKQRVDAEGMHLVLEGRLAVYDNEDRRMITHYLAPGEFFSTEHPTIAVTPTKVASMDTDRAVNLLSSVEDLWEINSQLIRRADNFRDRMVARAHHDIRRRVWDHLQEMATWTEAITHPDGMQVRTTRMRIAEYCGCTREMVGRVVTQLKAEGHVWARGKTFVIKGAR